MCKIFRWIFQWKGTKEYIFVTVNSARTGYIRLLTDNGVKAANFITVNSTYSCIAKFINSSLLPFVRNTVTILPQTAVIHVDIGF
jgi:hypothetical protein